MDEDEQQALVAAAARPERARGTIEDRLDAAEDRDAIRALMMRYGYLEDARRWDDMLALSTDDIEDPRRLARRARPRQGGAP